MRWAFALLMTCYLALGAMVAWEGYMITRERARSKKDLESIVLMTRFQRSSTRLQVFLEKYHILGEAVWMERFRVERDMTGNLARSISQGKDGQGGSLPISPGDRAKFTRNWDEYIALADSAFALGKTKARELYVTRAALRQEEMSLIAENTIQNIIRNRPSFAFMTWINLALAMLVVMLGLLTFHQMVVLPARRLAREAKRIAVGDLDGPVTMRAPGRLGQIADSLEELRMNLIETREQVKRLISRRPSVER
ncbi:MAG: HAMP domain-containing protein [candidate division WOR-3 bacterium]